MAVRLELNTEGLVWGGAREPLYGHVGVCHIALDLDCREGDLVHHWIGMLVKNPADEVVEAFFVFKGSTAAVQELFPVLGGLA
jgi:hypothetical protein